jgi:uncharacterized protein YebE (UPF0316 family)
LQSSCNTSIPGNYRDLIEDHAMDYALPLIILVARIVETSLDTVRTVYVSKGHANLAANIGVVKIGIWLLSTGLVLSNLNNYWSIFAYIAGYGIGTLLGTEIEKIISIGSVIVRIITRNDPKEMMERFANLGYGLTRLEGSGNFTDSVNVILMIVPRTEQSVLISTLSRQYPDVLYTIEDVRSLKGGAVIFHKDSKSRILGFFGF